MPTRRFFIGLGLLLGLAGWSSSAQAQHSVARQWNDVLIESIRNDAARPTVHARNLFHFSIAVYDAWALFDDVAKPYLINNRVGDFVSPFYGMPQPDDVQAAREEAISYAAYRLLTHRFQYAPDVNRPTIMQRLRLQLQALGYDPSFTSTDYSTGSAAALGNHIAEQVIAYGLQDGANEQNNYAYQYYEPVNPELDPLIDGNPTVMDPNRWQPLKLSRFIGQSGIPGTPEFVGPEWGWVETFSLTEADRTSYVRDGQEWWVFKDPGMPPMLDIQNAGGTTDDYQWNFALVAVWAGHLDTEDGVMWDISPGGMGNIAFEELPRTPEAYRDFYNLVDGGDIGFGRGHAVNPKTGLPYEPQIVPRGDFTRVLAEFWADGLDSETPPGHWYAIHNYVTDHPDFERRFRGEGPVLDPLEWDVKAYFALGGAVHDAAVAAWAIKGWYDYVRPVSAFRCMVDLGQSSDPSLPNYHPAGVPLVPGAIELVEEGDPLAGAEGQNIGKTKVKSWRGPLFILNPSVDTAGVDWILAEKWWPYQRPTFVSPPFAGYISGHSTFSRAAAELMTLLTGDPYFPGGLGEFYAEANEYLVFEDGPTVDVTLQWATYRDASDQCSLSRLWGGIHPPADDIPGRLIGFEIGHAAFAKAIQYFEGTATTSVSTQLTRVYPNPLRSNQLLNIELLDSPRSPMTILMYNARGQLLRREVRAIGQGEKFFSLDLGNTASGIYYLRMEGAEWESAQKFVLVR